MEKFEGIRSRLTYTHTLAAEPGRIFPLLCPIREFDWLPGWDCKLIHSNTGLVEKDCIFTTDHPGDGQGIWIATRHEPENLEVEYHYIYPGSHVVKMVISLEPLGGRLTKVSWQRTYTGLTRAGNAYIKEVLPLEHEPRHEFLEKSLADYLRREAEA